MPSWYIKAGIQGALSLLPESQRWNYYFQRHLSKGLHLRDAYFEAKLSTAVKHLDYYRQYHQGTPSRVVELGTGWFPIVPLAFLLSGVGEVISIDTTPLLRDNLISETLAHFDSYAHTSRLNTHLPNLDPARVEQMQALIKAQHPPQEVLKALGVRFLIADARETTLTEIAFAVSNSTLEHIPPAVIGGIFRNFQAVLSKDGLMSHLIDLSDHYSHFDRRLTPYHFLRYTEMQWRIFNNTLHYQSRLRVPEYRALHSENGWHILHEENHSSSAQWQPDWPLASPFAQFTPEELLVTQSWIVSRRVV